MIAVKRVHAGNANGQKEFLKEVNIMRYKVLQITNLFSYHSHLNHPNVLKFIGICQQPLCILTGTKAFVCNLQIIRVYATWEFV